MSSKESWDAFTPHGSEDDTKEKTPLLVHGTMTDKHSINASSNKNTTSNVVKDQNEGRTGPKDARKSKPNRDQSRGESGSNNTNKHTASAFGKPVAESKAEPLSIDETEQGWFLRYPQWFYDQAVILREEMQEPKCLSVSNQSNRTSTRGSAASRYLLDGDVYEQALEIISGLTKTPATHSKNAIMSWYDSAAFLLQSPGSDSLDFLNAIVRHLAKDIDADLLDLSQGLLEDILNHWFHDVQKKPEIFPTAAEYLRTEKGFPRISHFRRAFIDQILHLSDRKYLVDRLLTARSWKRHSCGQAYEPRPLIILLPDVTAYTVRWAVESEEFLGLLYAEVKRRRQRAGTPTIIIGTAPSSRTHDEFFPQSDMGREGISHVHQQLHLDPSLVMDVVPQRAWFMPRHQMPQVNRVDWWSRLRLALAQELQAPGSDFPGLEVLEPRAPPPLRGINAFLTHPAWTGDMSIKAFRQIVARARRKDRLDPEDMLTVLTRVAKNDAPFSFGGWSDIMPKCADAVKLFIMNTPAELQCIYAFIWLILGCIFVLLYVYLKQVDITA